MCGWDKGCDPAKFRKENQLTPSNLRVGSRQRENHE